MEKQQIRQQIKELRAKNASTHFEKSNIILNQFLQNASFMQYSSYFIYIATAEEVQTMPLITALLARGKRVFCPRTVGDTMEAVEVFSASTYQTGAFNIVEPVGEPYFGEVACAVVPMVAFDLFCNRLGHGAGFYDKFLQNFNGFKLGLAFCYQIVDNIEVNCLDIPMNVVLTEERYYARN